MEFGIEQDKILVISSPPAHGKTELLYQFARAKNAHFDIRYISVSSDTDVNQLLQGEGIVLDKRIETREKLGNRSKPLLIMVDQAEALLTNDRLWNVLRQFLTRVDHLFFVFAVTHFVETVVTTPAALKSVSRLTRTDLLLRNEEFDTLFNSLLSEFFPPSGRQQNLEQLHDEIKLLCGPIVGCLTSGVAALQSRFPREISRSWQAVKSFLYSAAFTNIMILCFKANYSLKLDDSLVPMLRMLFFNQIKTKKQVESLSRPDRTALESLAKLGLVINNSFAESEEDDRYVKFTSPLAMRVICEYMFPNRGSPADTPPTILRLIINILGRMSPEHIRQSVVRDRFPKEAVFQQFFFWALMASTPPSVQICPEVSETHPLNDLDTRSRGSLDFYVDGTLRWGLELLVQGSNIREHLARFERNGPYHTLHLSDYMVVDLRAVSNDINHPNRPTLLHDHLVTIFLSSDFKIATCFFKGSDRPVLITLGRSRT